MTELPTQRADSLRPGGTFLHYELLELIGVGGQGVVWSALDGSHNRVVAIKFSELTEDESTTFEGQAKNLVLLRHPHVLPLFDFGITNGMRFLVSLYAAGGSLQDRQPGEALSASNTIKIADEIALALDYLHGQGIIHRDLKPGNVLMDLSGNAYLCDFGLARMVSTTTQAIHTGHGTPPYSPPEQHKMTQITTASDIYSFGVMLYELFTGQLPWKGEKSLGIQQLYSGEVLPDPREINPELPEVLAHVLRQLTAPSPVDRPKTAGQAMQWIRQAFHVPQPVRESPQVESPHKADAEQLLKQAMPRWNSPGVLVALSATKFALVNLEFRQRQLPEEVKRFMLYTSLAYGFDDQAWWERVEKPGERFSIATSLLDKGVEFISSHALRHLLDDEAIQGMHVLLPAQTAKSLLQIANKSENESLKKDIFDAFMTFTPAQIQWREAVIGQEDDKMLGALATEDSELGDAAARLVGHLRSRTALETIFKQSDPERRAPALVEVLKVAGDLPQKLPASLRRSIAIQSVLERMSTRAIALMGAFGLASMGAMFGFGLQVFITRRMPIFLSIERFQLAIFPGLIAGFIFGLLILLIRIIAEFLREISAFTRITIATLAGGLLMSGAMVILDILFIIKRLPSGWLTPAACLLIAFGFAIGGNIRPIPLRMLLAAIAIFVAITGSWYLHRLLTDSISGLTPLFTYEYGWETWKILATAGGVALPMAILGNLPRLVPKK